MNSAVFTTKLKAVPAPSGHALDVAREVRSRTGKRGVDVVVDDVGPATWEKSLAALAKFGRLVTCGGDGVINVFQMVRL